MTQTLSPLMTTFFALIVLAVLMLAAWWMMRASARGQAGEGDRSDLDVYADQVRELDNDLAQGRIAPDAADAGRLEIGRRLVKARDRVLNQGPRAPRVMLGAMAGGVALLAGGLYFMAGTAGRADLPFVARERELLSRDPATLTQNEILLLLQERARTNPDDPKPHALMGQVLAGAGRDQDALRAYQAVLRRAPNDAEAIAEAAGIVTRLNNNVIGPDAQAAFDAALKINPNSPAARFYLGLNDWQSGRKNIALETWAATYGVLKERPDAQDMLAARVAEVMSQLDRGPQDGATRGPMQGGDPAAQAAFISSMVESRMARLAANPNDIALRLSVVRVLTMTGQNAKARQALLDGLERAEDNSFVVALYGAAARSVVGATPAAPTVTKR